jgi:hypothetical protein
VVNGPLWVGKVTDGYTQAVLGEELKILWLGIRRRSDSYSGCPAGRATCLSFSLLNLKNMRFFGRWGALLRGFDGLRYATI